MQGHLPTFELNINIVFMPCWFCYFPYCHTYACFSLQNKLWMLTVRMPSLTSHSHPYSPCSVPTHSSPSCLCLYIARQSFFNSIKDFSVLSSYLSFLSYVPQLEPWPQLDARHFILVGFFFIFIFFPLVSFFPFFMCVESVFLPTNVLNVDSLPKVVYNLSSQHHLPSPNFHYLF